MKIINVVKKAREILEDSDIKTPQLDAELLVSHVLKREKEYLHIYIEEKLDKKEVKKIFRLVKRRARGEPLAYILGEKSFYNLDFKVSKNTLVPRPETELMVEEVISWSENLKNEKINFIDVGTGSGCIVISLKNYFKNCNNFYFYGVDKYKRTLKIARENSKINKTEDIKFIKSDLLGYFLKNEEKLQKYNVITANLPYLTKRQYKKSPSIKKEPKRALISKESGLKHYKNLFNQIKAIKKDSEVKFYIICEIDPSQEALLKNFVINKFKLDPGFIKIKKDLAGLNRFIIFHLF